MTQSAARWTLAGALAALACATTPATRQSCEAEAQVEFERCEDAARTASGPGFRNPYHWNDDRPALPDEPHLDYRSCQETHLRALKACSKLPEAIEGPDGGVRR